MPGLFGGHSDTRELTAPIYTVTRGSGGGGRIVSTLLALMCVALAAYAGYQVFEEQFAQGSRVAGLRAENDDLRQQMADEKTRLNNELTDARMRSEMDAATRAELERQLEELNLTVKKLNEELSFYKQAQKSKP